MSRRRRRTTMMAGHRLWAALPLAVVALGAAGGCTQDFPPYNQLNSLRVLGIQSEPAAPLPGETSTLTPLVFTVLERPLSYAWSWCPAPGPAEAGHRCLLTEEELRTALGPDINFPPFDLGTAPTALLQNGLPPELLAAICAGAVPNVPRPNCAGGFPVQVSMRVSSDIDEVESVVTVRWRFDADTQAANANPVVDGVMARRLGADPQPLTPMLTDDTITLPRATANRVDAVVAPEASETYEGLDDDGKPATLRERLFITWFVEGGDTDDTRTSYIPDRTPLENMLRNTWTLQAKRLYDRDDARIYVVLHDNRGGVSWSSGIVKLEPTP